MKVAVLGAAGGIGQSLSLLFKAQLPAHFELALYDLSPVTPGIAVDLSHIPTRLKIAGFCGDDPSAALAGADIVMIPAGVARKPGMDRSDLFNFNATVIQKLIGYCAKVCPNACIGIITNPVNTTVPIAAEVLKQAGVYDRRKLFGITTLDVIRAETFVAQARGLEPSRVRVPVIGGHSGTTILPLLSQVAGCQFSDDEASVITEHVQNAGTEVVHAKAGGGSATLSMAMAGYRFTQALVRAMEGEPNVVEYAYVEGNTDYARFFAQGVRLGPNGIEEWLDIGPLSALERQELDNMLPSLRDDIALGEQFAREH
ncbi:malate dehydrogenase [Pseudaeromonas sp. ZJS20]|uniref:malate dehydrogenase n=1 Tax=Pseudaeromonas aegiceratis TaxID=3153928 RepID=UPI00390CA049